ncbi:nitrile hydratase accessory protein [Mycolicibacterium goodii]|uniref:Nitrile hydratase n=1 Tax=Mycolicibacterium goodii TaxID=134601 RepID=A0A0K0X3N3_MYCGD|nr:nitrile hydratase [Mycolicibacterium goodii]
MKLHQSCTTDQAAPSFDHEWQRRAFGLALALSEFGHYPWSEFQQSLIDAIGAWEATAVSETASEGSDRQADWQYYDHWVTALENVVAQRRLLVDTADQ